MAKPIFPYQVVTHYLLDQLNTGAWKPGDILPTEAALATQLRVHRLTVNRAMKELVREGRLIRHRGIGTLVSKDRPKTQPPVFGKGLVGLVTGHHFNPETNPYYGVIFEKMRKILNDTGIYLMPLGDAREFFDKQAHASDPQVQLALSAVALLGCGSPDIFSSLEDSALPGIIIGVSEYEGRLPSVATDDEADASLIAERLLALGHRDIVHINAAPPGRMHARLNGFVVACEKAGHRVPFRYVLEAKGLEIADGRAAMEEFLDRGLPFTAVFGGNDNLALGAMAALQQRGLAIPSQVSVVGFDGLQIALHNIPPLATMKVSRQRLAEQAAALIIATCSGASPQDFSNRINSQWFEGETIAVPPSP
jgi:DNA-binding LacI/PurR family transcriptional regulator